MSDEQDGEGDDNVVSMDAVKKGRQPKKPAAEKGRTVIKARVNERIVMEAMCSWPELSGIIGVDTFSTRKLKWAPLPGDRPGQKLPDLWSEADTARLLVYLQTWYPRLGKDTLRNVLAIVQQQNSQSSAQLAFDALPAWDGVERMTDFFRAVCNVEAVSDEQYDYIGRVSRAFFISVVARVYRPGCRVDSVLILEGRQGRAKSTLAEVLALDEWWFSDTMPKNLDSTDARDHVKGKLIIELPEMGHIKKNESEGLKAFISTKVDVQRSKFKQEETSYPRQCVFVGSTNEQSYLIDTTGNRRYWPIRCGEIDIDIEAARRMIGQVYAEAKVAFQAGEAWWFKADDSVVVAEQEERMEDADPWTKPVIEKISEEVYSKQTDHGEVIIHSSDMLHDGCGVPVHQQDHRAKMRIGQILKLLGAERKVSRIGVKTVRVYVIDIEKWLTR